MDNKILVTRSSMPTLDEYVEEIRSIWDSHWLTNMGVKHIEKKDLIKALAVGGIFGSSACGSLYKWPFGIGECYRSAEPARRR